MSSTVVTRWEDLRDITGGTKRHREAVAAWLGVRPAVLYWGDSWFSTPLYPNLARQSAARIDGLRMIVGKPGAQAAGFLVKRNIDKICDRIAGNPFDVLGLSIGGNDALSDRLEAVFAPWMKGTLTKLSPEDAFARVLDSGIFTRLTDRYRTLMDTVQRRVIPKRRHFKVVGHTYAPLHRLGAKGDLTISNIGLIAILKDDVGPWLFGPMARVLTDATAGATFSRYLLGNGFRDTVLATIASEYNGLFSYADFASFEDLSDDSFWYDEIHPTEAGFARLAPRYNVAIRAALPTVKQGAVD